MHFQIAVCFLTVTNTSERCQTVRKYVNKSSHRHRVRIS